MLKKATQWFLPFRGNISAATLKMTKFIPLNTLWLQHKIGFRIQTNNQIRLGSNLYPNLSRIINLWLRKLLRHRLRETKYSGEYTFVICTFWVLMYLNSSNTARLVWSFGSTCVYNCKGNTTLWYTWGAMEWEAWQENIIVPFSISSRSSFQQKPKYEKGEGPGTPSLPSTSP